MNGQLSHFEDEQKKQAPKHFDIDHGVRFALAAKLHGKFMLTYGDTEEIRALANKYGLGYRTIPMKTTHHVQKNEIIVSDNFGWW
jgi:DNA adenine methylase